MTNQATAVVVEREQGAVLPFEASEQEQVTLKFRSTRGGRQLANAFQQANPSATIEEIEGGYAVTSPYIRISRQEVESITGRLSDIEWKMLFVNREGDIKEFNDSEFSMGIAAPEPEAVEEVVEVVQFNVRIPRELKEDMDRLRAVLGNGNTPMPQHNYVAEALKLLNEQIKSQMI